MNQSDFLKMIQSRQDAATQSRALNKAIVTVHRIPPQKGQPARILIECTKPGCLDGHQAKKIWSEITQLGTISVGVMEIEIKVGGEMKMYSWLEQFLTRFLSYTSYKGVDEFILRGQWEKVQTKTGTFSRSDVQMGYFNTMNINEL